MTCAEIIARVDELEPNQYGTEQKMQWLSNLDDELLDECILTHKLDKTGRELELMLGTCPLPPSMVMMSPFLHSSAEKPKL